MADVGLGLSGPTNVSDRRTSPPLGSNNPFRNRVASGPTSPALDSPSARPISTNPFLDSSELSAPQTTTVANRQNGTASPPKATMSEHTRELFDNLTVTDKTTAQLRPQTNGNGAVRRPENVPPRSFGKMPPPGHRHSPSEEERKRMMGRPRGPPGQLDIFADPPELGKVRERRPRRNSETSVREKTNKLLDPEDEKRRHERRQRDAKRHGESKHGKSKVPSRRLDVIDKLDVTSIYGTGLFHHDGPFDACNPARNRKGIRAAPMQAFPKDSRNMSLGGSGPNNSRLNLDQINGTGHEAHIDYNKGANESGYEMRPSRPDRGTTFNATDRVEPVHGEETIGLGTSTFLEGAPASRAAIQRRATEDEFSAIAEGGGLSRKKSLAQKIRAVRPGGRMTSPEPRTAENPTSPFGTGKSESAANPFFKDYDTEYEKKGAQIAMAEEKMGRSRAPSSPKRVGYGLERKTTAESTDGGEASKTGGGFLNRVKSLKGGPRRVRAERRDTSG